MWLILGAQEAWLDPYLVDGMSGEATKNQVEDCRAASQHTTLQIYIE